MSSFTQSCGRIPPEGASASFCSIFDAPPALPPSPPKDSFLYLLQQTEARLEEVYGDTLPEDLMCDAKDLLTTHQLFCYKATAFTEANGKGKHLHANVISTHGCKYIAMMYPDSRSTCNLIFRSCMNHPEITAIIDLRKNIEKRSWGFEYLFFNSGKYYCYSSSVESHDGIDLLSFSIKEKASGLARTIFKINCSCWKDGYGLEPVKLLELVKLVERVAGDNAMPMVHCVAGLGRSGTFIAASIIRKLFKRKKIDSDNWLEVLCEVVIAIRVARWHSVQTFEQWECLKSYTKNMVNVRSSRKTVF